MNTEQASLQLSAIVVVGERRDDLAALAREYWSALSATRQTFELIFVIDGNRQDAAGTLSRLKCPPSIHEARSPGWIS